MTDTVDVGPIQHVEAHGQTADVPRLQELVCLLTALDALVEVALDGQGCLGVHDPEGPYGLSGVVLPQKGELAALGSDGFIPASLVTDVSHHVLVAVGGEDAAEMPLGVDGLVVREGEMLECEPRHGVSIGGFD